MISRTEYAKLLVQRRYRIRWSFLLLAAIPGLIALTFALLVYFEPFASIPPAAAKYLRDTVFISFSATYLRQLLISELGSDANLRFLLTIYWGFHVCVLLTAVILSGVVSYIKGKVTPAYVRGLMASSALLEILESHLLQPSRLNRFRLRRKAHFHAVVSCLSISPIELDWYKTPQHQWFGSSAMQKTTRSIVLALDKFSLSLYIAIQNGLDLLPYIEPIQHLQHFLYRVALRMEKAPVTWDEGNESASLPEIEILKTFARKARPLIIHTSQVKAQRIEQPGSWAKIRRVFESRLVWQAVGLSAFAGLVMILGVFIFKIEVKQAFLTWFTVAFGSLTISIGVTSIALARNPAQIPPESETR